MSKHFKDDNELQQTLWRGPTGWTDEELDKLQKEFVYAPYARMDFGALATVLAVEKNRRELEKFAKDSNRSSNVAIIIAILSILLTTSLTIWQSCKK